MDQTQTRIIDFSIKDDISDLYMKYGHNDSAHSFSSLYIWAKDMKISVHVRKDLYAAKLFDQGMNTWFFPVGTTDEKKNFIEERLTEGDLTLRYVTTEDVSFLREQFPGIFEITPAENDSEYICDRNTIENLPGKGLSRKRRYVKQLLKEHTFEIKPLHADTAADVNYILDIWRRNKDYDPNCRDCLALRAMLDNYSKLNITGIVIYMDDVPCSVMAGYLLGDDTIDCCIQKSVVNIYGLQYYVRQQFSNTLPREVNFLNFEEDLGIDGLRQAKVFMHPCRMIDMYTGRQQA